MAQLLITPNLLIVFVLVLTRITPVLMLVPVFGSRSVPVRVRAFVAIGISLIVTPLYWTVPIGDPGNVVGLAVLAGREAAIGLALGLGVMILFAGLQLAGQIVGQMSGMSLADVFDPNFDASVPIFSQFFDLVAVAVFVAVGGHYAVMRAILDTFAWMPPGQAQLPPDFIDALTHLATQSFALGIRAAAPIMIALLLSVLIMGLISRTLPQLNVLAVGFSFNSLAVLATLSISLGTAAWVFQDEAVAAIETLTQSLVTASGK